MLCVGAMCLTTLSVFAADDKTTITERIDAAKATLDEIMTTPDKAIPNAIMQQATCVAIIPGMKKGAFLVGAEYGQGVATCRTRRGWSAPAFIKLKAAALAFKQVVNRPTLLWWQ